MIEIDSAFSYKDVLKILLIQKLVNYSTVWWRSKSKSKWETSFWRVRIHGWWWHRGAKTKDYTIYIDEVTGLGLFIELEMLTEGGADTKHIQ